MLLLTLVAIVFALGCRGKQMEDLGLNLNFEWLKFKANFDKYEYNVLEDIYRSSVFKKNLMYITRFNKQQAPEVNFTLEVNRFADMTQQEFASIRLGALYNESDIYYKDHQLEGHINMEDLPASVDWRKEGYVTPVKDQGQCGSCWSFSTTGSIEGQHFKKTGKLVSFSEQQLVDCSWNMGCGGGLAPVAFEYVKYAGGLESEDDYKYEGKGGACRSNASNFVGHVKGFRRTQFMSEKSLQNAVAKVGPVSVLIDASGKDFRFYKLGVYSSQSCSKLLLDHVVLVVGYGSNNGEDYWIVKNSWGSDWGDKGYILMARNKRNMCGIATLATYPLM